MAGSSVFQTMYAGGDGGEVDVAVAEFDFD